MNGSLQAFALVIGNARSGTTIVGSILNSHPEMLCANETKASRAFWQEWTREEIVAELESNCADPDQKSRFSAWGYAIPSAVKSSVTLLADKIWNPTLLLVAGNIGLLNRLSETMGAPVRLIHCVRNPFDAIATMHRRSGAPLEDRMLWYFMHCEAAEMLIARGDRPLHLVRHEELTADAEGVAGSMFRWLGYDADRAHLAQVRAAVHPEPNRSRNAVTWPQDLIREIEARAANYAFLNGYRFDS